MEKQNFLVCPKCGAIHAETALRCNCGHSFLTPTTFVEGTKSLVKCPICGKPKRLHKIIADIEGEEGTPALFVEKRGRVSIGGYGELEFSFYGPTQRLGGFGGDTKDLLSQAFGLMGYVLDLVGVVLFIGGLMRLNWIGILLGPICVALGVFVFSWIQHRLRKYGWKKIVVPIDEVIVSRSNKSPNEFLLTFKKTSALYRLVLIKVSLFCPEDQFPVISNWDDATIDSVINEISKRGFKFFVEDKT